MNAKDLMIGDWVRITRSQWHEGSTQKVLDVYENGSIRTKHISPVLEDSYEPIPLTPEILEANGFLKLSCFYEAQIGDTNITIQRCKDWKNNQKKYINVLKRPSYYHIMYPEYVHELQHALRLCGLNEIADNFKVE